MRRLPALLALALCFVVATAAPASADARKCGGTAPTVVACSAAGTIGSTTIAVGCRSTAPAFSGYVTVRFSTPTGRFARTCYFANANLLSASEPVVTGSFTVGQPYWLDGDGIGAGGWEIYANA